MGAKQHKKIFAFAVHLPYNRALPPGNKYSAALAECHCACNCLYALDIDIAYLQRFVAEAYLQKIKPKLYINCFLIKFHANPIQTAQGLRPIRGLRQGKMPDLREKQCCFQG